MKYAGMILRLLLSVAAIVLLVLSMTHEGDNRNWLLMSGMLCSCAGLWLNIYFQRKERKK